MKRLMFLILVVGLFFETGAPRVRGQVGISPATAVPIWSDTDLDQMLGPIALYPDPLIAQLLPAATQPAEITLADRYLQGGGDPNQIDAQPWTEAVKAMTHYPEVLKWLDDNLAWTTQVGQAFLYQPDEVMSSIQRLRAQAQSLGNLQTTPQQTVEVDDGNIEIVPANPDAMYLPVYQPSVVYSEAPTVGFAPFITFGPILMVGPWLNHDWDWRQHRLVVWNRDHFRPRDWWYRPQHERFANVGTSVHDWRPRTRPLATARGEDRGWAVRPAEHAPARVIETHPHVPTTPRAEVSRQARPEARQETRQETQVQRRESRPAAQTPAQQARVSAPAVQPPRSAWSAPTTQPNGALVGVHSAQETHTYSNRGAESRQSGPAISPTRSVPSHTPAADHKRR